MKTARRRRAERAKTISMFCGARKARGRAATAVATRPPVIEPAKAMPLLRALKLAIVEAMRSFLSLSKM